MINETAQIRSEEKATCNEVACAGLSENLQGYESNEEFLAELAEALIEDYGIELNMEELEESGRNLTALLNHFL